MDQALKERLIGAAVILAAGVIVIPMLLDGPVRTQDTVVQDVVTLPVPAPPDERVEDEARPGAIADIEPEPVTEIPVAMQTQAAPQEKAAPPEFDPEPDPKPKPVPVAKPEATWAVQVGSFASADNARGLAADLEAEGFKAFVERWQGETGRVLYRVRVGPEPTRAEAEKLAASLGTRVRQTRVVQHEVGDES